jgi:H+-translocating NAD(P) transhydrogenase subunit alpha
MKIAVLRETQAGEARVALMPESIKKLIALGAEIQVESGAGLGAARRDDEFQDAGAVIVSDRDVLLDTADVIPVVNRPTEQDFQLMKSGAVVIGFLRPLDEPQSLEPARARNLTTFSVELISQSN